MCDILFDCMNTLIFNVYLCAGQYDVTQLVAQDYAHIKRVNFDEAFTLIDQLKAIKMFLGLSCSLMFTRY